jgi:hypothetical protein
LDLICYVILSLIFNAFDCIPQIGDLHMGVVYLYGEFFVLGLERIVVVFEFGQERLQLLGGHLFQVGMLLHVHLVIIIHDYYTDLRIGT